MGTETDSGQMSGSVPVGTGSAAVARIPIPGTNGLSVELSPRGYKPRTGSTSSLFLQDPTGKRHLRLDYGYNKTTGKLDYHWNQQGTLKDFKITNHTPAGKAGEALFKGARYFKYAGRALVVAGAAMDAYSIVVAKKRIRQVAKVAAGWGGAWAGCKIVGAGGAAIGSAIPGAGTAGGGIVGCAVGGIGGYVGGSWVAEKAYDHIEETYFEPLPETRQAE
jgi:hypothetical protein